MTKPSPPSRTQATLRNICPYCGQAPLYKAVLTLHEKCSSCGADFSDLDTADGPAFFGILIVSTIVTILALIVEFSYQIPLWLHYLLWLPLTVVLSIFIIRLSKSALIYQKALLKRQNSI